MIYGRITCNKSEENVNKKVYIQQVKDVEKKIEIEKKRNKLLKIHCMEYSCQGYVM